MKPVYIEARDLPDAWFQCIYRIFEDDGVHEYVIDRGSFEGHKRREFDLVMVHIKYPGTEPLIPDIPPELGIPVPTSMEYVEDYLQYLMTDKKAENELYTYGERLTNPKVVIDGKEYTIGVNPVQEVIEIYKKGGRGTNQAIMEIGMPQDIIIEDPPCLRLIDTRKTTLCSLLPKLGPLGRLSLQSCRDPTSQGVYVSGDRCGRWHHYGCEQGPPPL
jgi:thymidylate synthase